MPQPSLEPDSRPSIAACRLARSCATISRYRGQCAGGGLADSCGRRVLATGSPSLLRGRLKVSAGCRAASSERQTMGRGPEVQDVPHDRTIRLEALKDILAQVDGARAIRGSGAAMHGTGT